MLAQQEFHCPVGNDSGALEGGTHREFQFHDEVALVFFRDETLRYDAGQDKDADYGHPEEREHTSGVADGETYHLRIERGTIVHPQVYLSEYEVLRLLFSVRLEEFRAHDRAQGKGHDCRYDDRHGDGHCKLTEKLAGNSGQEAHRHEYGAEHK